MFIDIEATRQRLMNDKEELGGLFTSLGYREGLSWVEHDASKGELDFVSNPDLYRTLKERAKAFMGETHSSGLNVPMEVLYSQFGLSAVFRKILSDRNPEDFPGDSIVYFEQGFVDAVRDNYPYVVEEDEENGVHGSQESQG